MKVRFLIFIQVCFISCVGSDLQTFLGSLTSKVHSTKLSKNFLRDFLNLLEPKARKNFVFILEDLKFIQMSRMESNAYVESFQGKIFFSAAHMRKILQDKQRNKNTHFVVVLPRDETDDRFYIEDIRHQGLNLDAIMKGEDIAGSFYGDVLQDGERRDRIEKEIASTLSKFWKERILNVVVAKPQRTRVYTYTYFPYTRLNCAEHLVPVLTNVWFSDGRSFFQRPDFFPEKTENLFGCALNVSLILDPPAIIFDSGELDGIEGKILSELFYFLNATPHFRFVNSTNRSETAMNYVLRDVSSGVSDIGAGFLVPTKDDSGMTDCIYVSVNLCLTWAVPNRAKIKNFIAYIFETFTAQVWKAIVIALLISAAFSWFILQMMTSKASLFESGIRIVSLMLGEPGTLPEQTSLRMFYTFLICFSVLLCEIFQAGLGSNNIVVRPRSQLDSIEDVISSGLKIEGLEHAVRIFDRMPVQKRVKVKMEEIQNSLVKVGFERRTVYIGFKLPIKYYKNVVHPELRSLIHIHKSCLVTYQPFLALTKNSPFSERVGKFVTAVAENGYSSMLYDNFTKYEGGRNRKYKREEVDMVLFFGGLHIWGYGMLISFVAFLCECAFAKWRITKFSARIKKSV